MQMDLPIGILGKKGVFLISASGSHPNIESTTVALGTYVVTLVTLTICEGLLVSNEFSN